MNEIRDRDELRQVPTEPMPLPAAAVSPGPVTAAIRVARARHSRPLALALRTWPALPALVLLRPALAGSPQLGSYASQVLGTDALLCLVATLTVSPVITVAPCRAAALRWWYGVWMAVLGSAGLALAVTQPAPSTLAVTAQRAAGNSVNWTGTAIVILLIPMAAISNRACQRLLGPEWKRWQRALVWSVWWMVAVHLLVLRAWVDLGAFLACSGPLLLLRRRCVRRRVSAWRKDGYSSGRMWFALDVLAVILIAGLTVLLTEQGIAVARAAVLAPVH